MKRISIAFFLFFVTVSFFSCSKEFGISGTIKDEKGTVVEGVEISINGTFKTVTDANGYFEITDLEEGKYKIEVSKEGYSNSSQIFDVEKKLMKTIDFTIPFLIVDGDGNVYSSIKIGNQEWLTENLKTTRYNNGEYIPFYDQSVSWDNVQFPAYCWYEYDISYKDKYGALYNGYTVDKATNGDKNVCPSGWHVPSDLEWYTLESYVDPTITDINDIDEFGTNVGQKLKSKGDWQYLKNGTDNYYFNVIPSGTRELNDDFTRLGSAAAFWTNDGICHLFYTNDNMWKLQWDKRAGFSIRCIRD